jgi:hypothetical protein
MKHRYVLAVVAALAAFPAQAETVTAKVAAFDRVDKILVLDDKTIWTLAGSEEAIPDSLKAGDDVTIEYTSPGEDGVGKITEIVIN